jgi:DNA-binding FadR family transcriptional regulator
MPFVSHSDLVDILEHGTADDFRMGMRRHLDSHFVRLFG